PLPEAPPPVPEPPPVAVAPLPPLPLLPAAPSIGSIVVEPQPAMTSASRYRESFIPRPPSYCLMAASLESGSWIVTQAELGQEQRPSDAPGVLARELHVRARQRHARQRTGSQTDARAERACELKAGVRKAEQRAHRLA